MALSKPLCEGKVPLSAEQEKEVSALLAGALDSDRSQVLTVHVEEEEENALSGESNIGLFEKPDLAPRVLRKKGREVVLESLKTSSVGLGPSREGVKPERSFTATL